MSGGPGQEPAGGEGSTGPGEAPVAGENESGSGETAGGAGGHAVPTGYIAAGIAVVVAVLAFLLLRRHSP